MRYLLSFCILFLSGLTSLTAHSGEDTFYSPSGNLEASVIASFNTEPNNEAVIFSSGSERKGTNDLTDVAEVKGEEDKLHFLKKYSQNTSYYFSSFDSQSAVYFFHFIKNRTSLCKQLTYQSSGVSLNITLGVFRL